METPAAAFRKLANAPKTYPVELPKYNNFKAFCTFIPVTKLIFVMVFSSIM